MERSLDKLYGIVDVLVVFLFCAPVWCALATARRANWNGEQTPHGSFQSFIRQSKNGISQAYVLLCQKENMHDTNPSITLAESQTVAYQQRPTTSTQPH